jgi:ADP-heptose:LPS heptosyltransferase
MTPPADHAAPQSPATGCHPHGVPISPDCLHYRGDKPCLHNRLCDGCTHYAPQGTRIIILKLGALGDVIRTLCILPTLRRLYPGAHITWVSKPSGCRMIAAHPMINRVLPFDAISALQLTHERFDLAINLDKEAEPCALMMQLKAGRKLGIGLSEVGTPVPLNREAVPYFLLGLSDELKFRRNTHSYPQLVHAALGLLYLGDRYTLPIAPGVRQAMRGRLASRGWRGGQATVGINVGSGTAFANKMWPTQRIVDVVNQIRQMRPDVQVLLLGGTEERDRLADLHLALAGTGDPGWIDVGCDHDEKAFPALLECCDVLFSGDTMAMHAALAVGRRVVVFFGPTCEQEIELFGLGEKLIAGSPCSPCYKRTCDQQDLCVHAVSTEDATRAIMRQLDLSRRGSGPGDPAWEPPATYPLPQAPYRKAG